MSGPTSQPCGPQQQETNLCCGSFAIIGSYGGIIILIGIWRLFAFLVHNMTKRPRDPSRFRANVWYRKYILEAPFLPSKTRAAAHEWFHGSLIVHEPGRIHVVALLATLVPNLVCCFAFYHTIPDSERSQETLGTLWQQHVRSFSDRAALLVMAQLPLVFLFAGHNSLVILLTGCTFNTIMVYHRWLARLVTILTIGHAIGYTIVYKMDGYYSQAFGDNWWNWGIASASMFVVACSFAYTFFRRFSYELFLFLHITFVMWALIGLWKHIQLIEGTQASPYLIYLWVAMIFWIGDRLLRLTWTALLSIRWRSIGSGKRALTRSEVRSIPDGTLVVRVRPAGSMSRWMQPRAGQHIMLNMPGVQHATMHAYTVMASGMDSHPDTPRWYDLGIKPVNGFSRRLAEKYAAAGEVSSELVTFVEGPYGHCVHTDGYGSIILLAAGIGVTHTVAVLLDALKGTIGSAGRPGDQEAGSTLKQRIDFMWVCRTPASIPLLIPYLVQCAGGITAHGHLDVHVRVFLSGGATSLDLQDFGPGPMLNNQPRMTEEEKGVVRSSGSLSPLKTVLDEKTSCPESPAAAGRSGSPISPADSGVIQELPYAPSSEWPEKEDSATASSAARSAQMLEANLDKWLRVREPSNPSLADDLKVIRKSMHIAFHLGRPNIKDVLTHAIAACPSVQQHGRTSTLVSSCGPEVFCDEVRHCVRGARTATTGIDFDEEVFAW